MKRKEVETGTQSITETCCLQSNNLCLEKKKEKKLHFQIPGLSVLQDWDPRGKDFHENSLNERIPL